MFGSVGETLHKAGRVVRRCLTGCEWRWRQWHFVSRIEQRKEDAYHWEGGFLSAYQREGLRARRSQGVKLWLAHQSGQPLIDLRAPECFYAMRIVVLVRITEQEKPPQPSHSLLITGPSPAQDHSILLVSYPSPGIARATGSTIKPFAPKRISPTGTFSASSISTRVARLHNQPQVTRHCLKNERDNMGQKMMSLCLPLAHELKK